MNWLGWLLVSLDEGNTLNMLLTVLVVFLPLFVMVLLVGMDLLN